MTGSHKPEGPSNGSSPDQTTGKKPRLLVFVVAYNAEKTIGWVLQRIPHDQMAAYDVEALIIDDASHDDTFYAAEREKAENSLPFPVHILRNPVNQGYGGNQKLGFQYAIDQGFDIVALVHGDGQYAPERLPELAEPLRRQEADAVFGSRMLDKGAALKGGMPMYKFIGNKILTTYQNWALRSNLSEFHSGYRLYSVAALKGIPFHLNSQVFHFDTQIIIQLIFARKKILELPIPTYYGDEICHVDGLRYAWDVFVATLKARCQEYGIFYDRAYDCVPQSSSELYEGKLDFESPHSAAEKLVSDAEKILDLGGGNGVMAGRLSQKGCTVTIVDLDKPVDAPKGTRFVKRDLNAPFPKDLFKSVDCVLMLDVIEHLADPEAFVDRLREDPSLSSTTRLIASTGNVAFVLTRLSLTAGMFNYGKRGILDRTHTRLFTIATFRRLMLQAGFEVDATTPLPAPFPLAFGDGILGRFLVAVNRIGLRLLPGLFAYQVLIEFRKRPTLGELLDDAHAHSDEKRKQAMDAA